MLEGVFEVDIRARRSVAELDRSTEIMSTINLYGLASAIDNLRALTVSTTSRTGTVVK